MRPLGAQNYTDWSIRNRSDKDYRALLQLPGDKDEKNDDDLMLQDTTLFVDEFQTRAEIVEAETQVLDDFSNGFGSDLVDDICDTQVIEEVVETCEVQRGSLEGELRVLDVLKDGNDVGLEDMEGDTQILEDNEDVMRNELANFGSHTKVTENQDDHCEQLCTEGVAISNGKSSLSDGDHSSSRETDHPKLSSDRITDGIMNHFSESMQDSAAVRSRLEKKNSDLRRSTNTSQSSQKHDGKESNKSGYVPLSLSDIRIESLQASAAAARSRLEKKNLGLKCFSNTTQSSKKQDCIDSDKLGYVPPSLSDIRIESMQASAVAARSRLEKKKNLDLSSANTSQSSQKHNGIASAKSGFVPLSLSDIRIESMQASAAAAQSRLEKKNLDLRCSTNTNQSSQKHDGKDSDKSGYVPLSLSDIRIESLQASAAAARSRLEKKNLELKCSNNTSQSSQKRDDNDTNKSGYKPLRFTEIHEESLIASGLAAGQRALKENKAGAFYSVRTSHAKQELINKETDHSFKGSPSSTEGADDYDAFYSPKDRDFGKQRKVKSSVARKLFAEEAVLQSDSSDIIANGDKESDLSAEERDFDAVGQSYVESQEPNDIAQAQALAFVEKFLSANLVDIDKNDNRGSQVKTSIAKAHGSCEQCFVKKSIFRSAGVGLSKAFDWDDNNEDEGGGAFFCKLKQKSFNKESELSKSATPIQKSNSFDSKQHVIVREQSEANHKKIKLSYSASGMPSKSMKMAIKNTEENAKRNTLSVQNQSPCTGNIASHKPSPDMPITDKYASAGNLAVIAPQASRDDCQSSNIENGASEGISTEQTRKESILMGYNLRKRARLSSDVVSKTYAQSIQTGHGSRVSQDTPGHIQDAKFDEQPIENSARAGKKIRKGDGHIHMPSLVTTKGDSYKIYSDRQVETIKPDQSKTKPSGRTVSDQAQQKLDIRNAILRRSSRLNKGMNSEDSSKQHVNQGENGLTLEHGRLVDDAEAMHLSLHADTSLVGFTSECSRKRLSGGRISSKDQGKNSEIMTCTRQTRRVSIQNGLNPSEMVHNGYVKQIEHSVDTFHAKRGKTSSHMDHNHMQTVELHVRSEFTSSNRKGMSIRRSPRLQGSLALNDTLFQNGNKQLSAGVTEEWNLNTDIGSLVDQDTSPVLEISPRQIYTPCTECVTPTNHVMAPEEPSPICNGNEYYKISRNQKLLRSNKEISNLVSLSPIMTLGLTDAKKRRVMSDVRVLFSRHLEEDTLMRQKKIVNQLGACIASSISDATHFIADKFVRTKNMLEAISLAKPVVTPLWLVSCCESRFHIDEKAYILRDKKKEREIGFRMPASLDLARRQPLLQKRRVFITQNTKPGKEIIACLVKAVCGQVIERIVRSAMRDKDTIDDLLILTCEEDFAFCEPFLDKGAKVYSSELLLNGIVTQRLEYERYRLFDNSMKRMHTKRRMYST